MTEVATRPRRQGRLWLVGAGPGDPDLLTVAARRLLDEADIVVHDRLVGDAILATIPPGTPRINVGKTGYAGGADQAEINRRLADLVRSGHDVVRLKGGDPFVFGRGAEELLALAAEGIEVHVVPGITAGIAAPAAYGIPDALRAARSVAFVTGHDTGEDRDARLDGARAHRHRRGLHGRPERIGGRRAAAGGRPRAVDAGRRHRRGHHRAGADPGHGPPRAPRGRGDRGPFRAGPGAAGDRRRRGAVPAGARRGDGGGVTRTLRIGTRGSALAMIQARWVAEALATRGTATELVTIRTEGDQRAPDTAWGEGAFVRRIEAALLDGSVDVAVHSAKDVPTDEHPALVIAAYPVREDPRDALVCRVRGTTLATLPAGSRVGTDSPRRTAFLLAQRPDLAVHPLHGNVDTRLTKLDRGESDALVLAVAGLTRLGRADRIDEVLPLTLVASAPGQGSLAVQVRADDAEARDAAARLDDPATRVAVETERAILNRTGGGLPVADRGRGSHCRRVAGGGRGRRARVDAGGRGIDQGAAGGLGPGRRAG